MHAASGLVTSGTELLAFASRQFAPKIVDLSVSFLRNLFHYSLYYVCPSEAHIQPSPYVEVRRVLFPNFYK